MAAARDLRPLGPLSTMESAIALARDTYAETAGMAWGGGAIFAAALIAIYYVERVEGIGTLRLPLALGLVLAFFARSYLVAGAARRAALRLWDAKPSEGAGRPLDVFRTSMVVGAGLWIWGWLLVLGSLAGPLGVVLVLPLFAFRGAAAPSWLARASCERDAGFRAFFRAAADNAGRRVSGVFIEAMVLAGTLAVATNLYALTAIVLILVRSFGGIELASFETFLSPSNTFVLLCVLAVAFVVMEPLRAALSAVHYVDARVRSEGLDLRAAIEDAITHAKGKRAERAHTAHAAIVLLALAACAPSAANAQDSSQPDESPTYAPSEDDRETEQRIDSILAQPEFREFEDHRGDGLRHLIERMFAWLLRPRDLPRIQPPRLGKIPLPGAPFFLGLGALLLVLVGAYLWITRAKDRKNADGDDGSEGAQEDPRARAPASFLDEAARLADVGDLREALRALYLATLVALDRRALIAFDPHLTNWQYLRQMPRGSAREAFAQLTRLFDYKWYGREETTRQDYERCLGLARDIVHEPERAA